MSSPLSSLSSSLKFFMFYNKKIIKNNVFYIEIVSDCISPIILDWDSEFRVQIR